MIGMAGEKKIVVMPEEIVIPRGSVPRVHPNGPIQLDLSERTRLHVWLQEPAAKQKVHTPIHDHTFDYESTVLLGGLANEKYVFLPDPSHAEYVQHQVVPVEGHETKLVPFGEPGRILKTGEIETWRGESYAWFAHVLHWAFPLTPVALTLMNKIRPREACLLGPAARVIVPSGQQPDNDFRRDDYPTSRLWQIIAEALRMARVPWGFE